MVFAFALVSAGFWGAVFAFTVVLAAGFTAFLATAFLVVGCFFARVPVVADLFLALGADGSLDVDALALLERRFAFILTSLTSDSIRVFSW